MSTANPEDPTFERLLEYLRDERGFDFTGYKRSSLGRRVQKRMQTVAIESFDSYRDFLEANPDEFTELFNTILINVTSFFRDPASWDFLAEHVLPNLPTSDRGETAIRCWSAGCASGQEAYSLAMLLCEAMGEERFRSHVKVYATDVDEDALAVARTGRYPRAKLEPDVSEERLSRFFEPVDGALAFRRDLRRSVIFGRHDLVQDPPISRVDLPLCRNTLMYFQTKTQRRILANFAFALKPRGYLFLGKSEALATRTDIFNAIDPREHVFVPTGADRAPERPAQVAPPRASRAEALVTAAYDAAPIAQVVVDREGDLVLANHEARTLFGIGVTQVGLPLRDLQLSYRPVDLRTAIEQVHATTQSVLIGPVEWRSPSGDDLSLEVRVAPLRSADGLVRAVGVSFIDLTALDRLQDDLQRAQRDLETAYEELQSTVEELETTNEELQSTNEELETTNEELHSTNEELETMNEELHSTNEELETINNELRERSADLDRANAFMNAILGSLGSGIAVLDRSLDVLVWSRGAEDLWGLRADEVQGRPLPALDIGLPVTDLRQPAHEVVNDGVERALTVPAVNRRGRPIECTVTLTRLDGTDGAPSGVIVRMEATEHGGGDGNAL